jgi:ATP-binding cassette, subfamily F, member 3
MSILTITDLEKSFGVDLLFSGVTFSINAGQKMGLVGRNGCGKTTLLRIVMGLETADGGRVSLASGRRLGYLRQEAAVHPENTILEEVLLVFAPLREMENRLQAMEHAMAEPGSDTQMADAMAEYAALRDAFDAAGGYHYAADVDLVLERLGIGPADQGKRIGSCSGGEQTRVALARIVLSKPDLLILDEPTNHLDIAATEWLEGFLKSYEGAVILVSHDRYFLDAVTDTIGEMENQRLSVYRGNYSHYRRQKDEQVTRQQALYEQQQAEIARLEDIVKRNMAANATQSHLRLKTVGRIERMDKVERPKADNSAMHARIDADSAGRVSREVVRFDEIGKSFGDRTLFADVDYLIERGDRVGLVGPNGSGKTTLVKILLGSEQASHGRLTFGHNVRLAYFSQHASESLDSERTVMDTILDCADMTSTEARNYLARFLFMGDDVFKTVGMLSGGEKNKLALARMILEPCNLLILDEPTNHLDIGSCEVLTEMLSSYKGTLLLISHDRYLLNATTTKTFALLGDGRYDAFEGNYAAWREAVQSRPPTVVRQARPGAAPTAAVAVPSKEKAGHRSGLAQVAPPPAPPPMNARDLSKARVKARENVLRTEEAVARIESRISEVEAALANPSDTARDMVVLAAEHTRLQDDLLAAFTAWEEAVSAQEALE